MKNKNVLLPQYIEENDLILDTHLGSQSSRIAASKAGLSFIVFKLTKIILMMVTNDLKIL